MASLAASFASSLRAADRTTLLLDGTWDIEDSKDPGDIPKVWNHTVPVPGLVHSAQPAFPQVDEFDSRQLILNRVRDGKVPASAIVQSAGRLGPGAQLVLVSAYI
jgi:hypothetical protein